MTKELVNRLCVGVGIGLVEFGWAVLIAGGVVGIYHALHMRKELASEVKSADSYAGNGCVCIAVGLIWMAIVLYVSLPNGGAQ